MLDNTLAKPVSLADEDGEEAGLERLNDSELLGLFARLRKEEAFAVLLRRHGPMVLSVCRRVLRHSHDAEDAFQATFLVLAEQAHRLRQPELLANWLYGVAYRTALHARQRAIRRHKHETEAATMFVPFRGPEIESRELQCVLDEELNRLPEKYRAPLVLCYLNGKTNEEAARLLGWPSGSMSHRLARGRDMLRRRLQGRLAALSLVVPMVPLAKHLQPAAVPTLLAKAVAQSAVMVKSVNIAAAGTGIISASVRELVEAALLGLAPARWRWLLAALLLLVALLGIGAAVTSASGGLASSAACPCGTSP